LADSNVLTLTIPKSLTASVVNKQLNHFPADISIALTAVK
jgi:hypothetical protein